MAEHGKVASASLALVTAKNTLADVKQSLAEYYNREETSELDSDELEAKEALEGFVRELEESIGVVENLIFEKCEPSHKQENFLGSLGSFILGGFIGIILGS